VNPYMRIAITEFLDNLAHEYPRLDWELDENNQIVIWEEEA